MRRFYPLILIACLMLGHDARAQGQVLSVPPDTSRWDLYGEAKPDEYQGRRCLMLNGGLAFVRDFQMRDGVIDVDIATTARGRGFIGLEFRASEDVANAEWIYLRPHE